MAILTLRPNSDVAVQCVRSTGSTNYGTVDEASPSDADFNFAYTAEGTPYGNGYDDLGLPNHSSEQCVINSVKVLIRYRMVCPGPWYQYVKSYLKIGSTRYLGSNLSLTTQGSVGWTTAEYTWYTNPATGTAFTWQNLDDLIVSYYCYADGGGGEDQGGWAGVSWVEVQVDYTPAVNVTATPALMTATAAAIAAAIKTGIGIAPPPMAALSGMLSTGLHLSIAPATPPAAASAQLQYGSISVAPLMQAAAGMLPPSISLGLGLTAPLMQATGVMLIPTILRSLSLPPGIMAATAEVIVPGIVAIDTPPILILLDGQYATITPHTNAVLVIGRDVQGNPVQGSYTHPTETGKVGTQYDFVYDSCIPTAAQAGNVAAGQAVRMRLQGKTGWLLVPQHCGIEQYDIVVVADRARSQTAAYYRVTGIRYEYNPKKKRYQQRLTLCSV